MLQEKDSSEWIYNLEEALGTENKIQENLDFLQDVLPNFDFFKDFTKIKKFLYPVPQQINEQVFQTKVEKQNQEIKLEFQDIIQKLSKYLHLKKVAKNEVVIEPKGNKLRDIYFIFQGSISEYLVPQKVIQKEKAQEQDAAIEMQKQQQRLLQELKAHEEKQKQIEEIRTQSSIQNFQKIMHNFKDKEEQRQEKLSKMNSHQTSLQTNQSIQLENEQIEPQPELQTKNSIWSQKSKIFVDQKFKQKMQIHARKKTLIRGKKIIEQLKLKQIRTYKKYDLLGTFEAMFSEQKEHYFIADDYTIIGVLKQEKAYLISEIINFWREKIQKLLTNYFPKATEEQIKKLLVTSYNIKGIKEQIIYRQGDPIKGQFFYLNLKGEFALFLEKYKLDQNFDEGDQTQVRLKKRILENIQLKQIKVIPEGEFFGEAEIVNKEKFRNSAVKQLSAYGEVMVFRLDLLNEFFLNDIRLKLDLKNKVRAKIINTIDQCEKIQKSTEQYSGYLEESRLSRKIFNESKNYLINQKKPQIHQEFQKTIEKDAKYLKKMQNEICSEKYKAGFHRVHQKEDLKELKIAQKELRQKKKKQMEEILNMEFPSLSTAKQNSYKIIPIEQNQNQNGNQNQNQNGNQNQNQIQIQNQSEGSEDFQTLQMENSKESGSYQNLPQSNQINSRNNNINNYNNNNIINQNQTSNSLNKQQNLPKNYINQNEIDQKIVSSMSASIQKHFDKSEKRLFNQISPNNQILIEENQDSEQMDEDNKQSQSSLDSLNKLSHYRKKPLKSKQQSKTVQNLNDISKIAASEKLYTVENTQEDAENLLSNQSIIIQRNLNQGVLPYIKPSSQKSMKKGAYPYFRLQPVSQKDNLQNQKILYGTPHISSSKYEQNASSFFITKKLETLNDIMAPKTPYQPQQQQNIKSASNIDQKQTFNANNIFSNYNGNNRRKIKTQIVPQLDLSEKNNFKSHNISQKNSKRQSQLADNDIQQLANINNRLPSLQKTPNQNQNQNSQNQNQNSQNQQNNQNQQQSNFKNYFSLINLQQKNTSQSQQKLNQSSIFQNQANNSNSVKNLARLSDQKQISKRLSYAQHIDIQAESRRQIKKASVLNVQAQLSGKREIVMEPELSQQVKDQILRCRDNDPDVINSLIKSYKNNQYNQTVDLIKKMALIQPGAKKGNQQMQLQNFNIQKMGIKQFNDKFVKEYRIKEKKRKQKEQELLQIGQQQQQQQKQKKKKQPEKSVKEDDDSKLEEDNSNKQKDDQNNLYNQIREKQINSHFNSRSPSANSKKSSNIFNRSIKESLNVFQKSRTLFDLNGIQNQKAKLNKSNTIFTENKRSKIKKQMHLSKSKFSNIHINESDNDEDDNFSDNNSENNSYEKKPDQEQQNSKSGISVN